VNNYNINEGCRTEGNLLLADQKDRLVSSRKYPVIMISIVVSHVHSCALSY